jgi:integrase
MATRYDVVTPQDAPGVPRTGKEFPDNVSRDKKSGILQYEAQVKGRKRTKTLQHTEWALAMRRLREIQTAADLGKSGWSEKKLVPTFAHYFTNVYRPTHTVNKTPCPGHPDMFIDDYLVANFMRVHGSKPLDEFTASTCQGWTNEREKMWYLAGGKHKKLKLVDGKPVAPKLKRISKGTVTREAALVSAIFSKAVVDEVIAKNPWTTIKRPAYDIRHRVVTMEEQDKLLVELMPKWSRWLLFMIGSGLRIAECRGISLKNGDVNFGEKWVQVTRKTKGGVAKKVQKVSLFAPGIVDIMQEQIAECGHLWPESKSAVSGMLRSACRRAGIAHVHPHALRHMMGARYLEAGGDIHHLSVHMGHEKIETTKKIYGKLGEAALLRLMQPFDMGLTLPKRGAVLTFAKR